jgi:hypothetical protein
MIAPKTVNTGAMQGRQDKVNEKQGRQTLNDHSET